MGKKGKKVVTHQIKKVTQEGKFCLNMIMKNEEKVILRCLNNVKHLIDAVAIVDTGSTDTSIVLVEEWCQANNIPCDIRVDPWDDDFGRSRTLALRVGEELVERIKAQDKCLSGNEAWYLLFMDCDNQCFDLDGVSPISVKKSKMWADGYRVEIRDSKGIISYSYLWMIKVDRNHQWRWYGPCHEYLSPIKNKAGVETWTPSYDIIEGGYIISGREGSRSNDDFKYLRDAIAFEKALINEPMNDRYLYYVAQSYRDAATMFYQQANKVKGSNKDLFMQLSQKAAVLEQRAEKAFIYRASVPPFNLAKDEYTYMAWLEAGKIRSKRLERVDLKSLEYFKRAHQLRPKSRRLEAAYYLLNYYIDHKHYLIGWTFIKDLVSLSYPSDDIIFVDKDIHTYLFLLQASICAYHANHKHKFIELSKQLIDNKSIPQKYRDIAQTNLAKFGSD